MSNVIKEWKCAAHGSFDGSHPICPRLGCESENVAREFRTPVGFKSDTTKMTDTGLRKTVDDYKLGDLKSAREGESSKANYQGAKLLWGDDAQAVVGRPLVEAHTSPTFSVKDEKGQEKQWKDPGGMRIVANDMGITQNVLPQAEVTKHLKDK